MTLDELIASVEYAPIKPRYLFIPSTDWSDYVAQIKPCHMEKVKGNWTEIAGAKIILTGNVPLLMDGEGNFHPCS